MLNQTSQTQKGIRGFQIDMHVSFKQPLPEAEALFVLGGFQSLTLELYTPHPTPLQRSQPDEIRKPQANLKAPSARLTGTLSNPEDFKALLTELLSQHARSIEIGQRGFLRSIDGYIEWMPWRKNTIVSKENLEMIVFQEGIKYILE